MVRVFGDRHSDRLTYERKMRNVLDEAEVVE